MSAVAGSREPFPAVFHLPGLRRPLGVTEITFSMSTGGYTSGSLGGLLGALGANTIVNGCIDTVP
jgi:hypothetical protein